MKPTAHEIAMAVGALGGALRFFPQDERGKLVIMEILERMVGTKQQLDWLVNTLINSCNDWPGPKELRGIFCTRFKPADGIEGSSTIHGFTADDGESKYQELQSADRMRLAPGKTPLMIAGGISKAEMEASGQARAEIVAATDRVKSMEKSSAGVAPEWLKRLA